MARAKMPSCKAPSCKPKMPSMKPKVSKPASQQTLKAKAAQKRKAAFNYDPSAPRR